MNGESRYINTATVISPKRVTRASWWISAPQEKFTEQCRRRLFQEEQTERQQRRAAGIVAEQKLRASRRGIVAEEQMADS